MNRPTQLGANRTGVGTAPDRADDVARGSYEGGPSPEGAFRPAYEALVRDYLEEEATIGTMPPPSSLTGVAQTAVDLLQGQRANVLLDKMGERLAFERTGARLYDLLLLKFEVDGSWPNGPTREALSEIRDQEREHFRMMVDCMREVGADPTATTPSADLVAMESLGLQKVVSDPRTTVAQALHAMWVAELTDSAAWELLTDLADEMGRTQLASRFRQAAQVEAEHLRQVQGWLAAHGAEDAGAT